MTWNEPKLPSGIDDFTAKQQPNPAPVDDLSRFVLDRIREAETEPRIDGIPQNYYRHGMAIAHRYAKGVRDDMAAFRQIVEVYTEHHNDVATGGVITYVMLALANRWAGHHEFQDDWRLDG